MTPPAPLPQRISGDRVSLRRSDGGGDGAEAGDEAGEDAARYEVRRRGERAVIGEVVVRLAAEGPFIERLCIEEEARGYGAGSGAATALLRSLARRHAVVHTWAPPDRGLAVYFWMRMGFRPLPGEGPDGGLRFEQRLRKGRGKHGGRRGGRQGE